MKSKGRGGHDRRADPGIPLCITKQQVLKVKCVISMPGASPNGMAKIMAVFKPIRSKTPGEIYLLALVSMFTLKGSLKIGQNFYWAIALSHFTIFFLHFDSLCSPKVQ